MVKKTAVVTDNVELDKLFKKVSKTDKEGAAEATTEKRKEKEREQELSKERKKVAEDLHRLAALKKVADTDAKKAEKEKKEKEKKEKEKAEKAKLEEEKKAKEKKDNKDNKDNKDKDQKEKAAPKNEPKNVPRLSPKSKKPKSIKSDTDADEPKTEPIPKPSPLSKKPKGYKPEPQDTGTDAGVLAKTSRQLKFDDDAIPTIPTSLKWTKALRNQLLSVKN